MRTFKQNTKNVVSSVPRTFSVLLKTCFAVFQETEFYSPNLLGVIGYGRGGGGAGMAQW